VYRPPFWANVRQFERFLDIEAAGDAGAAARNRFPNYRGAVKDAVENDREVTPDRRFGDFRELIRAFTVKAQQNFWRV
jgi:hypothetical protein